MQHQPVLVQEVLQYLNVQENGVYIDATFGRGGHAQLILDQLGSGGRLLAIDRDPDAIAYGKNLVSKDPRLELVHAEFSSMSELLRQRNLDGLVNGVLFDLGVSSPQLETSSRGFSFLHDGPLDMRMNPEYSGPNATQWINQASEKEIAQVLRYFGDERYANRIAGAIVTARQQSPIERTKQLADIVAAANPNWEQHKHPATRSFMAIRIHINQEFEELRTGLSAAIDAMAVGGRLLVVSFHSLEDKIVKRLLKQGVRGDVLPRTLPVLASELHPQLRLVSRSLRPRPTEIEANPRARSATLRVAEKIG